MVQHLLLGHHQGLKHVVDPCLVIPRAAQHTPIMLDMLPAGRMLGDQGTQCSHLSHNLTTPAKQTQDMACITEKGARTHWHVCVQSGQPCSLHRHPKGKKSRHCFILAAVHPGIGATQKSL